MFDYYVCGVDIILSDVFVRSAVNVILCYFMIGTVFWVPISFYVCWFMKYKARRSERKAVLFYLMLSFVLWPLLLRAAYWAIEKSLQKD